MATNKHRMMASNLKEDLSRLAEELGYADDLDDDDLNVALNEVANEINTQKLRVNSKRLSSRVSSRVSSRASSRNNCQKD